MIPDTSTRVAERESTVFDDIIEDQSTLYRFDVCIPQNIGSHRRSCPGSNPEIVQRSALASLAERYPARMLALAPGGSSPELSPSLLQAGTGLSDVDDALIDNRDVFSRTNIEREQVDAGRSPAGQPIAVSPRVPFIEGYLWELHWKNLLRPVCRSVFSE